MLIYDITNEKLTTLKGWAKANSVMMPANPSSELLAEHSLALVYEKAIPPLESNQYVRQTDQVLYNEEDDRYELQFEVLEVPLDAYAARVRKRRDAMLAETDWTQVSDAPVDQEAWATYRQELRDITTQDGFPTDITWPTKPE